MTSWAKPGVKCVCIDSSERAPLAPHVGYVGGLDGLQDGGIYTIREVYVDPDEGNVVVRLNEIWRCLHPEETTGREAGYCLSRFRPLITKTQEEDVSMFLELLQKQEEPA